MRNCDLTLLIIVLILAGVGIIFVYSSSAIIANDELHDSYYYLKRQIVWFIIGIILMRIFMNAEYDRLRKSGPLLLLVSIALLVLVLVPGIGKTIGGATRWIKISSFTLQPSELAKLACILYAADSLTRKQAVIGNFFRSLLPHLIIIGALFALLLLQPDFGTAIVIFCVIFVMCFISGIRLTHLFLPVLIALPFICVLVTKVGYRHKRILAFIDPWKYEKGSGFQIIQSFIALGSGGLFGSGLTESKQKLFFLPNPFTDFIFAVIGEELGFIGVCLIILLFIVLLYKGMNIALQSKDMFYKLLAVGVTSLIGIEAIINIGVNVGLLPTKGTTLPFISYGGSSLIFKFACIGILLNVSGKLTQAKACDYHVAAPFKVRKRGI